jgi:hypothetical protein
MAMTTSRATRSKSAESGPGLADARPGNDRSRRKQPRASDRGDEALAVLRDAIATDRWLNFAVRGVLASFALIVLALAARYTWVHGDSMVEVLQRPRDSSDDLGDRLLALTTPVLLLIALALIAGVAALVVHSRGMEETYRVIDSINRIRREDEVAVSARGLTHSFEEKLHNASRAFSVLLWFGRTLFIVCLGLFSAALVQAMTSGVDVVTVALGATSITGTLLGVATGLPAALTRQLADVLQLQSIVTGCDRQMSLLESHAFSVMNRAKTDLPGEATPDYAAIDAEVRRIQRDIDHVVDVAVDRIQAKVEDDKTPHKRRRIGHRWYPRPGRSRGSQTPAV